MQASLAVLDYMIYEERCCAAGVLRRVSLLADVLIAKIRPGPCLGAALVCQHLNQVLLAICCYQPARRAGGS